VFRLIVKLGSNQDSKHQTQTHCQIEPLDLRCPFHAVAPRAIEYRQHSTRVDQALDVLQSQPQHPLQGQLAQGGSVFALYQKWQTLSSQISTVAQIHFYEIQVVGLRQNSHPFGSDAAAGNQYFADAMALRKRCYRLIADLRTVQQSNLLQVVTRGCNSFDAMVSDAVVSGNRKFFQCGAAGKVRNSFRSESRALPDGDIREPLQRVANKFH